MRNEQSTEPTNAAELGAQSAARGSAGAETSETRVSKLSEAELAWERLLEGNLGDFYLPRYKQEKAEGKPTAWDYVEDDPALPRYLIIGDSISRAYTLTVRGELEGIANVHRAPENCGPTENGIRKLDLWLGDGKWDVISFNFGIHDRETPDRDYFERLKEITEQLMDTGAKLLWVSSTPLSQGEMGFTRGMMIPKNQIATEIMNNYGIPVLDLYTIALEHIDEIQLEDGCHLTDEGNELMGTSVARRVMTLMGWTR